MKPRVTTLARSALCALALLAPPAAYADESLFIIRDAAGTPREVADRIQTFAEANDRWLLAAAFDLYEGAVISVKMCYIPIGPMIAGAGLHVIAMMPCGNLAVYAEDGRTRVSMLHLSYMALIEPHMNLEAAAAIGQPAFEAMLEAILE